MADSLLPSQTQGITQWRSTTGYDVGVEGDTLSIVQTTNETAEQPVELSMDLSEYRMATTAHDPDSPSLLKLYATDRW